jgi:hypothetical protein
MSATFLGQRKDCEEEHQHLTDSLKKRHDQVKMLLTVQSDFKVNYKPGVGMWACAPMEHVECAIQALEQGFQ